MLLRILQFRRKNGEGSRRRVCLGEDLSEVARSISLVGGGRATQFNHITKDQVARPPFGALQYDRCFMEIQMMMNSRSS